MKVITAIIERNEDAFFAFIPEINGCVAGGRTYHEVKSNLKEMLQILAAEEEKIAAIISEGYELEFEVDLESVFELIPEVNVSQLAKEGGINPGLLRQYASGAKKASEKQTQRIMGAIQSLSEKLNTISVVS